MLPRANSAIISLGLISATFWLATTGTAHAYVDAGTGSMVLQILIAGFFGALLTMKVFWRRITSTLSSTLAKIRPQVKP